MYDDLEAYFHENVLDTYRKYVRTKNSIKSGLSDDLKSAVNIATILFHLREYLPHNLRKSKKRIAGICPDYALIEDIANVSKHHKLTHGTPKISNAENIEEQIVITEYQDEQGSFTHIEKSVFATLDDGSERDVFEIITNVLNMWISELESAGIIKGIKQYKVKKNRIAKRSKNSGRLDMKLIHGIRIKKKYKIQKYNYEKGIIEPVDLTGMDMNIKFFQPTHTVVLGGFRNKGGKEQKIKIELTDQEKKTLIKLKSDKEKMLYFLNRAVEQDAIKSYEAKPK